MKGIGLLLLAALLVGGGAFLLAGDRELERGSAVPVHELAEGAVEKKSRSAPSLEPGEVETTSAEEARAVESRGAVPEPVRSVSIRVGGYLLDSHPSAPLLQQEQRSSGDRTAGLLPLPGVRFEIGVGWGAFDLGPGKRALVDGVTGEDGTLVVEVEVPEHLVSPKGEVSVFGRLDELGFQDGVNHANVPLDFDEPVSLVLLARRGGSVRGVVRDEADRGVLAEVSLLRGDELVAQTSSDFRGQYELRFEEDGLYRVSAEKARKGTALSREFAVVGLAAPPSLDLQLQGPGRLFGTVADQAGRPIEGLDVVAEAVDPIAGLEAGLGFADVRTDRNGHFDLPGLRRGLFRVWALPGDGLGDRHLLTPQPVSSTAGELWLILEEVLLRVRIVDFEGKPAPVTLRGDADGPGMLPGSHPAGFFIEFVSNVDGTGTTRRTSRVSPRTWNLAAGEAVIAVAVGETYAFGVVGRDGSLVREEVTIPSGAEVVERTLRRGPAPELGKVQILPPSSLLDEGSGSLFASVSAAPVGVPVKVVFMEAQAAGKTLSLPVGRYSVRARRKEFGGLAATGLGPVDFEIRAGETTIVRLGK